MNSLPDRIDDIALGIHNVSTTSESFHALDQEAFELVFLQDIEDQSILKRVVSLIKQRYPHTLIIAVVDTENSETGHRMIDAGLDDFIVNHKINDEWLKHTLQYAREKRQAIDWLNRAEKHYRTKTGNLPATSYQCKDDEHYTVLKISDNIKQLSGYPPERFLNNEITLMQLFHPEDTSYIVNNVSRALERNHPFHLSYRIKHRDGRWRWVEEFGSGVFDESHQLLYLEGVIRDITNRKIDEDQLVLFRYLMQKSTELVFVIDADTGRFLDVNEAACSKLEYSKSSIREMCFYDINHSIEDETAWRDLVASLEREGEKNLEANHKTLNGRSITLELTLSNIRYDNRSFVLGIGKDISKRKKEEEQIRILSQAVEQNPTSIMITDVSGNIEYVNPFFTRITGYSRDEVIGKNPRILKSGMQSKEFYANLWNTIRNGEVWRGELHNVQKNGKSYWEFAHIAPIKDEQGAITHFLAIKEDITERKVAENELKRNQQIVSLTNDGMSVIDSNFNYQITNEAYRRAFDVKQQQMSGRPVREFFGDTIFDSIIKKHLEACLQGKIVQYQLWFTFPGLGKRYMDITYHPLPDSDGTISNIIESLHDITDQKKAEESLKMFAQAIASVTEIICITDLDYNILFVNDSFLKVYDCRRDEVHGHTAHELQKKQTAPQLMETFVSKTRNGGWQGELMDRRKNGTEFPLHMSTSTIYDEHDQPIAYITVANDITKQKRTEEDARRAEMLKTVQELAGAVSHEFSQPLQALSNYINLMELNNNKKEYLTKSRTLVNRIAELVQDLRRITDIQKQDYLSTKIIDIKASANKGRSVENPSILVVDDEEDIQHTMVEMLKNEGYKCNGAGNGLKALQLINDRTFDLIISDINMPVMSGTDLFKKVKALGYSHKFLFITGYAVTEKMGKIIDQSDGIISKPIDFKQMLSLVQEMVGPPKQNEKESR